MRRKDREIVLLEEIDAVLNQCSVCRIAMIDGDRPYVIPMNFGMEWEEGRLTVYVHCAKEGRKMDILRRTPRVCFEADREYGLIEASTACGYGCTFASVIGEGTIEILDDPNEKAHGLSAIMRHQTGKEFSFSTAQTEAVCVLRLRVDSLSGKRRKL